MLEYLGDNIQMEENSNQPLKIKAQKSSTKTTKATKMVASVKSIKAKKETKQTKNSSNPADAFPITIKKQEVKRVIDMFNGTKNTPKTPVNKIAEILKIDKKQVFRVLHKHSLKTYKESSLK
jgi:hypothetical protein